MLYSNAVVNPPVVRCSFSSSTTARASTAAVWKILRSLLDLLYHLSDPRQCIRRLIRNRTNFCSKIQLPTVARCKRRKSLDTLYATSYGDFLRRSSEERETWFFQKWWQDHKWANALLSMDRESVDPRFLAPEAWRFSQLASLVFGSPQLDMLSCPVAQVKCKSAV